MIALPYNEYLQRYGASRRRWPPCSSRPARTARGIPWSYWHERAADAEEYLRRR